MDRERLQQVHQTDLTESRLNEDFLDWLKTRGMSWLLVILIALCAYIVVVRLRERGEIKRTEAWLALADATTPGGKEEVADTYTLFGVPQNALLDASAMLLAAVQRNQPLEALDTAPPAPGDPVPPPQVLTEEERTAYLGRIEDNYQKLIAQDDGTLETTIYVVSAMTGMAAAAESRLDPEAARSWYEKAAARAEKFYPHLAERTRSRIANLDRLSALGRLPTRNEITNAQLAEAREARTPVRIDATLEALIFDEGEDEDAGDGEGGVAASDG